MLMMRLWRMANHSFRSRRMREFETLFGIDDRTRVLDVGGTSYNWQFVEAKPKVTLLNRTLDHLKNEPITARPASTWYQVQKFSRRNTGLVAGVGEACKKQNAKACSVDKTQVLSCTDGHMASQYFCRGEGQCNSAGGKLACDQTVAKLGDPCDKTLSGHIACSEDKKSLITCQAERFVPSEKCKAGTVCTVSGQSTKCEKP